MSKFSFRSGPGLKCAEFRNIFSRYRGLVMRRHVDFLTYDYWKRRRENLKTIPQILMWLQFAGERETARQLWWLGTFRPTFTLIFEHAIAQKNERNFFLHSFIRTESSKRNTNNNSNNDDEQQQFREQLFDCSKSVSQHDPRESWDEGGFVHLLGTYMCTIYTYTYACACGTLWRRRRRSTSSTHSCATSEDPDYLTIISVDIIYGLVAAQRDAYSSFYRRNPSWHFFCVWRCTKLSWANFIPKPQSRASNVRTGSTVL